jgi:GNAT superfamily N-acetyltransferase
MNIRRFTRDEIIKLYHEQMHFDFPESEIKPLERILVLFDRELYFGYGLFEADQAIGYALFVKARDGNWLLLDYFAICSQFRNSGYGSLFLNMLINEVKETDVEAIMIEIESIESSKSEEDLKIRSKRKEFYLKNEIITTNIYATIFGIEFEVMNYSYNKEYKDKKIIEEYTRIYQTMLPSRIYKENCYIKMFLRRY